MTSGTELLAHGVNVGYAYTKYVLNLPTGDEQSVVFPSLLAPAQGQLQGALRRIEVYDLKGQQWWVGEDALLGQYTSDLRQDRLNDRHFIPVMVRAAVNKLRIPDMRGVCVSGLPASWSEDKEKGLALAEHLRYGGRGLYDFRPIKIINEPLAVVYSQALDVFGEVTDNETLVEGRVAVVDLGHYTVDVVIVNALRPEPKTLATYTLGTSTALSRIRSMINGAYELDLSLYEVDQSLRRGTVKVAGQEQELPKGWDSTLMHNGDEIASRLTEEWKRGANIDCVLIAGGGAELAPLAQAIAHRFQQSIIAGDGQIAIARGYARFARRLTRKPA